MVWQREQNSTQATGLIPSSVKVKIRKSRLLGGFFVFLIFVIVFWLVRTIDTRLGKDCRQCSSSVSNLVGGRFFGPIQPPIIYPRGADIGMP